MANADEVTMYMAEEATFATNPGAGNFQKMRFRSEGFNQGNDTVESQEIDPGRQVVDVLRSNVTAGGPLAFELSYGTYDKLWQALLQSADWSAPVTFTGTVTFGAASQNLQTLSATGIGTDITVGRWVKVSGTNVAAANAGYFKVTAVSADEITIRNPAGTADASVADTNVVAGGQITNAKKFKSFWWEKEFAEDGVKVQQYSGFSPNMGSLEVSTEGIITGQFDFMGSREILAEDPTDAGGASAPTTTQVMNAVDNVVAILENGSSCDVTSIGIQMENNLRKRGLVGTLGAAREHGSGKFRASGTLEAYHLSDRFKEAALDWTTSSMAYVFEDADGNAYVIDFPRVRFTQDPTNAGGENSDVMDNASWVAHKHPSEGITVRMVRFSAA